MIKMSIEMHISALHNSLQNAGARYQFYRVCLYKNVYFGI